MTTSELNALYYTDKQGIWYSPKWEPNPALKAWVVYDHGDGSYECRRYGGYNIDGGLTWAKEARNLGIVRWMYLPTNAEGYTLPTTPKQLTLFN